MTQPTRTHAAKLAQDTSQQVDGERERLARLLEKIGDTYASMNQPSHSASLHRAADVMREMERENEALRAALIEAREEICNPIGGHDCGNLMLQVIEQIDAALDRSNAHGATPKDDEENNMHHEDLAREYRRRESQP